MTTACAPIAILGYGCRFPGGVNDGPAFWEMLRLGRDAICDVPVDRWNLSAFHSPRTGIAGKTNSRWGGFIEAIDQFEPECFGISPREAAFMDPQQRLLLETAWEALEQSGLPVAAVAGTRTGVFVGISTLDYARIQSLPAQSRGLTAFSATGTSMSIAANRLSYCLDLRGPSFIVDTACSSSLVALDRAVKSLCDGESDLALVGGVNLIITPETFVSFSAASMLAPDGRCKAFDASGDGFVRAEGVGLVVLKRLDDALRNHDPIRAVVRATGVNQDGRTGGIAMPNVDAQEALLREVYGRADIPPADVAYVEAHGTGTAIGDPVEAEALGRVFGLHRHEKPPLIIGSVKTNIGHLEAGSGMASLIKVILMLQHRQIPPSLNFHSPNPRILFDRLRLRVPVTLEPWPEGCPCIAGINSFGFGGTNAHAVLAAFHDNGYRDLLPKRQTTATTVGCPQSRGVFPFVLTARSPKALQELAAAWLDYLPEAEASGVDLSDVAYSALMRRSRFRHGLAFAASSFPQARASIDAYLAQKFLSGLYATEAASDSPNVAFVFCGQGAHWYGMGRELLKHQKVFRETLQRCDALFRDAAGWSLLDELAKDETCGRLDRTSVAQPVLFGLQVALAELWRSWGIVPAAVVGHSVGEIAAACVAGALSLDTAVRIVAHRGICLEEHARPGRMVAAGVDEADAVSLVKVLPGVADVAAVNSPQLATFAGDDRAIDRLGEILTERQIWWKPLAVSHAFHTSLVDPARDAFLGAIGVVENREPECRICSTVTGRSIEPGMLTAAYWWNNIRRPVRFADAVQALLDDGIQVFLELGPHPVLGTPIKQCQIPGANAPVVFPSLRRDKRDQDVMLSSLAGLYAYAIDVNGAALWPNGGTCVGLPPHPWLRQPYWHECAEVRRARLAPHHHPLLGQDTGGAVRIWEAAFDPADQVWMEDHRVGGQILLPAAGFVELALAAAIRSMDAPTCTLDDLLVTRGLFLSSETARVVQTLVDPASSSLSVHSRASEAEESWVKHFEATFHPLPSTPEPENLDAASWQRESDGPIPAAEFYRAYEDMGFEFGSRFRGVVEVHRRTGSALGRVQLPDNTPDDAGFHIHPALLDSCFQVLIETFPPTARTDTHIFLPERAERVNFRRAPGRSVWSEARLRFASPTRIIGDIRIFLDTGEPAIEVIGLRCQAVPRPRRREAAPIERCFYRTQWHHRPLQGRPAVSGLLGGLPVGELVCEADLTASGVWHDMEPRSIEDSLVWTNRLAHAFVARGLRDLGTDLRAEAQIDLEALLSAGKVLERFRLHFDRGLELLVATGEAVRSGDQQWTLARDIDLDQVDSIWREALARHPDFYHPLRLVELCGARLADVWSGAADPLSPLFSEEGIEALEHLYQDHLLSRYLNTVMQQVLSRLIQSLPEHRPLRILEVGAGTGGTTCYLLPVLPPRRSEYWFTDLSPLFLLRAEEKFRSYDFIKYRRLDIEKGLEEQDVAPGSFDVVIAADVLHATRDLSAAIQHCREALAQGGLLIARELCRPPLSHHVVFGLTEGWWNFAADPSRTDGPHLPRQCWRSLLETEGFEQTHTAGADTDLETVLVARRPHDAETIYPPLVPAEAVPPERKWLVFADRRGHATDLIGNLRGRGLECIEVRSGEGFFPTGEHSCQVDLADAGARLQLQSLCRQKLATGYGVIYMWALDIPAEDNPTVEQVDEAEALASQGVLHVLQALADNDEFAPRRILLITRGAREFGAEPHSMAFLQTSQLGIARVAANEFPAVRVRLVDLDPARDNVVEPLWAEMVADETEEEVVWRGPSRFVPRLVPETATVPEPRLDSAGRRAPAFGVVALNPGNLDSLQLVGFDARPPEAHEVQVDVHFVALNFRDILRALGRFPAETPDQLALGDECAGIVRAVGEGVTHVKEGDRVLACSSGSFRSILTIPAHMVFRVPENLSLQAAVSMPVAFITADYALRQVGRLQPGERVLIHSAAGGVGMAAVQLARRMGARIYATAGTSAKRELLVKIGAERVMDSRSLDFPEEILRATDGQGVDVVLNSLSGQAMIRSLACLGPYGRFLELGKRDFFENTKIGLWPFHDNVSYHAIDVIRLLTERPQVAIASLDSFVDDVATGSLSPLPIQVLPVARAVEALRRMGQGFHIGKIVLDMTQHWEQVRRVSQQAPVRPSGTYVVTGAFGGAGLVVTRWLVERGARHLALIGRSGPQTGDAFQLIEDLQQQGVNVRICRCDVGDSEQLGTVFRQIEREMPPPAGILHLAMVIDDDTVLNSDSYRLHQVMRPKVQSACNLHRLTRHMPLDFFVLFSSISASVGHFRQGSYSAANAALEGLAAFRRACGLPATAIGWGMLGGTGYVAERPEVRQFLSQMGLFEVGPADLRKAMEAAISSEQATVVVARADWQRLLTRLGHGPGRLTLLSQLGGPVDEAAAEVPGAAREAILAAPPEARAQLISQLLRSIAGRVLGMNAEKIEDDCPLAELGLDSLMGMELAGQVESQLILNFPIASLSGEITIAKLSRLVLKALGDASATVTPQATNLLHANNSHRECLVEMGGEPGQPALFCFHPVGGELRIYDGLVGRLSARYRIFGLQSRLLASAREEFESIHAMATTYADLIEQVSSNGPISLFGFSFGGLLAMETSHMLEERERTVNFVALAEFDPQWGCLQEDRISILSAFMVELYQHMRREFPLLADIPHKTLRLEAEEVMRTLVAESPAAGASRLAQWFSRHAYAPHDARRALMEDYLLRVTTHIHLMGSPNGFRPIKAPIHVWRASRGLVRVDAPWQTLSKGAVDIRVVDGSHFDLMVSPGCHVIAEELATLLEA